MPQNVEIKARVSDMPRLEKLAAALCAAPGEVIVQEDVFFNVPKGRLKLRKFSLERGELIYYERSDSAGPKVSDYSRSFTNEPAALEKILTEAFGVRAVVRKRRTLYLCGQTRIHLDEVEGLGSFVELEVVLGPGQSPASGERIALALMKSLAISPDSLVQGAYVDLLSM
jgi:predicted adenylyl cyclase CyaB